MPRNAAAGEPEDKTVAAPVSSRSAVPLDLDGEQHEVNFLRPPPDA